MADADYRPSAQVLYTSTNAAIPDKAGRQPCAYGEAKRPDYVPLMVMASGEKVPGKRRKFRAGAGKPEWRVSHPAECKRRKVLLGWKS